MAKLSECLKGTLPPELVRAQIWAMIGEPKQEKCGYRVPRRKQESRREMFRAGQGQRVRKRVTANCTQGTGSIVASVRVGAYTTIVCKCKM